MSWTRLWRGNGQRTYRWRQVGSLHRGDALRQRWSVPATSWSNNFPPFLPDILAEVSRTRPLASPHDGYTMIPRTLSSAAKKRVMSTVPVRKRDASTSPGVGAKARTVLSRLPIPPLRSTLDKYLQSIKPLLLQDDLQGISTYDPAYQRRVEWAKEFETGVGTTLQARLIGIHYLFATAVPTVSTYTIICSAGQDFTA